MEPADGEEPGIRRTLGGAGLAFAGIALVVGVDLALDARAGTELTHVATEGFAAALDAATAALGRIEAVVVTAGLFATQEALEADRALTRRLLEADFSGTVLFCEEARDRLLASGGGKLCVFASVAGERGRKPVVLYGAAKAGLLHYLEGLDHRFRARGLVTVAVLPGFVRTSMTEGLP